MKSLLPELKVTTLTTNDDSCYFIVYKDNLFIVDDSSDLDKLAPYFVEHPQMDRCGDWGNPFNAVEDFDEPADVRFVEGRVHFVQHAERAGLHLVNREQQRHSRHGLLAARQQ